MITLTGMANSHYFIFYWRYENAYIQIKRQAGIGSYVWTESEVTIPVEQNIKPMIENVQISLMGRGML